MKSVAEQLTTLVHQAEEQFAAIESSRRLKESVPADSHSPKQETGPSPAKRQKVDSSGRHRNLL